MSILIFAGTWKDYDSLLRNSVPVSDAYAHFSLNAQETSSGLGHQAVMTSNFGAYHTIFPF